MVTFSRYTEIAYQVADRKGFGDQLRGPGTQARNQRFIRELAQAYNSRGHSEATEAEARQFLMSNVMAP